MKGIFIPEVILNDKRLNPTEMCILSIYHYYTKEGEKHCCLISNEEIADLLHIGVSTIKRAKQHLKELGLIIHNGGIKVWYSFKEGVQNDLHTNDDKMVQNEPEVQNEPGGVQIGLLSGSNWSTKGFKMSQQVVQNEPHNKEEKKEIKKEKKKDQPMEKKSDLFATAYNEFITYNEDRLKTKEEFFDLVLSDLGKEWIKNVEKDEFVTKDQIKDTLKMLWNKHYCSEGKAYPVSKESMSADIITEEEHSFNSSEETYDIEKPNLSYSPEHRAFREGNLILKSDRRKGKVNGSMFI